MMRRIIVSVVVLGMTTVHMGMENIAYANDLILPAPGVMVHLSPRFNPPILKGLKTNAGSPLQFDFILEQGDDRLNEANFETESAKLIKYFLAGLTIPEEDLWVNLSPYEQNRIIPNKFGSTEMGKDLLAEDYLLKQLTASLVHPEGEIGKKFWSRVYTLAQERYGSTHVPVNTFNKVWIVPDESYVFENDHTVYIESSKLKVLIDQDYAALFKHSTSTSNNISLVSSQIMRDIIIPELTKEVNGGKNFAPLRQIYSSLILAIWYKNKLQTSVLNQVYSNKNKIDGVDVGNRDVKQEIYNQYLDAFKKGVYNFIKDDIDPITQGPVPKKYFSGGFEFTKIRQGLHRGTFPLNFQPPKPLHLVRSEFQAVGADRAMPVSADGHGSQPNRPNIDGYMLYPEGERNSVYPGAHIENGRRVGGKFLNAFPHKSPTKLLMIDDEIVIEHAAFNAKGELVIAGNTVFTKLAYANEKGIIVHIKEGIVVGAYKDGIQLYSSVVHQEGNRNSLYVGARIENGRRVGGTFVGTYPIFRSTLFEKYPEFILTNVKIQSNGLLRLNGKNYGYKMFGYENSEGNTVHFRNAELLAVYDKDGKPIISSQDELKRNAVYKDVTIHNGKKINGTFVGAFPNRLPSRLLRDYNEIVIENAALDSHGILSLGGKIVFQRAAWANETGITVHVKGGKVLGIYKNGKELYFSPFDISADPFNNKTPNSFYIHGLIKHGRIVEGEFIGAYPKHVPKDVIDKNPSGIITNAAVNKQGYISLASHALHLYIGNEYAGQQDVMIVYNDKKITHVFDAGGRLLYRLGHRIHYEQGPESISSIIEAEDLKQLIGTMGVDGAIRLLARLHGLTLTQIKGFINNRADEMQDDIQNVHFGRGRPYVHLRNIAFIQALGVSHEAVLTQELSRSLYKEIIKDHRVLESLLTESTNTQNSELLRRVYRNVYDYYMAIIHMPLHGFNDEERVLKLHQKEAIKFLIEKKKAVLADDQGVGKTVEALMAVMNIHEGKGAKKVLIICPRSAEKKVWESEIKTKLKGSQDVVILDKNALLSPEKRKELAKARFVITHYEAIIDYGQEINPLRVSLQAMDFDAIIIDEAHRLRNESLRTEAIQGFDAEYKFLLSGTPQVGRDVRKIYRLLHWLYPENENFSSLEEFHARYYGSPEKIRRLREDTSGFVLRRLKKDVLDLPPLRQIIVPVKLNPKHWDVVGRIQNDLRNWARSYSSHDKPNMVLAVSKFLRSYQAAIDPLLVEDNIIFHSSTDTVVPVNARTVKLDSMEFILVADPVTKEPVELINIGDQKRYPIAKGPEGRSVVIGGSVISVSTTRDIVSSKYEALDELIAEIKSKNPSDKIVIFSSFRPVIEKISRKYRKYGVVTFMGGLSEHEMESRIEEFQNDDNQTIFASTIQSGGEAISLTAANHVIFMNDPLTYQEKIQAIDRVYRWLQTKEVNIYTLVAKNSVDERISSILEEGRLVSQLALEDDPTIQDLGSDLIRELLKNFRFSDDAIDQIMAFRDLSRTRKPAEVLSAPHVYNAEKGIDMAFKEGKLKARLTLQSGSQIDVLSFDAVFEHMKDLSDDSLSLLKEFVQKHIEFDIDNKIPIKDSLMWSFAEDLIAKMKYADYDYDIERNVEIGMVIIDLLMGDPDLSLNDVGAHIDDQYAISQALDFLDRNNIFKMLSLLKILPRQYYYSGQLVAYKSSFMGSYRNHELIYRDVEIIDRIAPNRRNDRDKPAAMTFESLAHQFRELTREEEIRLAIEAYKRNDKAIETLLEHNMLLIIRMTKAVYNKINIYRPLKGFTRSDFEDAYQNVAGELTQRIKEYGPHAQEKTFREYFGKFISQKAAFYIHKRGNIGAQELLLIDQNFFPDSDETFGDRIAAPNEEDVDPDMESGSLIEESDAYARVVAVLRKGGFQDLEIDIFKQFAESNGVDGVLHTHGQSKAAILDIIKQARAILQSSGELKHMLENQGADAAMITSKNTGGIDLTSIKKESKAGLSGDGVKFSIHPKMLKELIEAKGFVPVIKSIQPLQNFQSFVEVALP